MLRFGSDITSYSISSIASGRRVSQVADIVIDPNDLTIAAFVCVSRNEDLFLLTQDIHSVVDSKITIQNEDSLTPGEDLVKLSELLSINFKVVGKKVKTDTGRRVGQVVDFVFDDQSFKIIKLNVRPPITKLIQSSDLIISRTQIVELNDKEVVVKESIDRKRSFAGIREPA